MFSGAERQTVVSPTSLDLVESDRQAAADIIKRHGGKESVRRDVVLIFKENKERRRGALVFR